MLSANHSQIEPAYRLAFEQWLDARLADASDEAAELAQIRELIALMESGRLIVNHKGQINQVLGTPAYDDPHIAARLRLEQAKRGRLRRDQLTGVALMAAAGLVLLYLFGVFDFGDAGEGQASAEATVTPLSTTTPIAQSVLELADDLGSRVRLGQPRTLEIQRQDGGGNLTLAVIPAEVDESGRLPYFEPDEETDARDEIAVWVFGTVINYVFGIPEPLVRSLAPGDTILMRTATGAVYRFEVAAQWAAGAQEVELFSQRQPPGLTLFALPASGEPVPVARALYLAGGEAIAELPATAGLGPGEAGVRLSGWAVRASQVTLNETLDGLLVVEVRGDLQRAAPGSSGGATGTPLLLSLVTPTGQYAPVESGLPESLVTTGVYSSTWRARWSLPPDLIPGQARLHLASPDGSSATIQLGDLARPGSRLQATIQDLAWDELTGEVVVGLTIANPPADPGAIESGTAHLNGSFFHVSQQGGDVYLTTEPVLPILIEAGGQVGLELRFRPGPIYPGSVGGRAGIILQTGQQVWEITGLPMPPAD